MRKHQNQPPYDVTKFESDNRLFVHAQTVPDATGTHRYTGHCVVGRGATPEDAAARLVFKLRREGNTQAVRGALGHNVYEKGNRDDGPIWNWVEHPENDLSPFKGCRAAGEGSYYREPRR